MLQRLRAPALLLAVVAVLAAACGSGESSLSEEDIPDDAIVVTAENSEFDRDDVRLPAQGDVSIYLRNEDAGIAHNISIYPTDTSRNEPVLDKPIFEGETFDGVNTRVYTFQAPEEPGLYFAHCDVHPNMTMDVYFGEGGD